jgi:raffinose/stachyose/melibiose transport system permease protein
VPSNISTTNVQNQNAALKLAGARKRKYSYYLMIVLFLLPASLFYGTFNVYGTVMTFYYSLLKWSGIGINIQFAGLDNFQKLLQDPTLWHSLSNNIIVIVTSIAVQIPLGLLLALIINLKIKGSKLLRTVYFMPMLLSTVAIGILWSLIYDPNFGMLNSLLDAIGLGRFKSGWLGNEKTVLLSILITICWQFTPLYMILMKAGLTNISEELYESAYLDGATKFQAFRGITLPLMSSTIKTASILSLVGSLKYFDLIYIMSGGGPNGASELMATYMYKKGFVEFDMGYGSSIAAFMFIVALILATTVQYFQRRGNSERGVRA